MPSYIQINRINKISKKTKKIPSDSGTVVWFYLRTTVKHTVLLCKNGQTTNDAVSCGNRVNDELMWWRWYCCARIACHCVMYGGRSRASSSSSSSSSDVSYKDSGDDRQQGIFTSPNHPQIYPTNVNCILYTFIAAPQQIIEITFSEFDLQIPATSKSEYVLSFCRERGERLKSKANGILLQFISWHLTETLMIEPHDCLNFPHQQHTRPTYLAPIYFVFQYLTRM